ncbi:hypothetical protein SHKM778_31350 [Streptomyces sp. KM77-8]|uniref:Uncharacterized protein n=1 Tax=Streptomyces haneummycinicus TaxID=3074435 RepID=A0AAT9HH63_9ACTN
MSGDPDRLGNGRRVGAPVGGEVGSAIQVHSFARCPKNSVPAGSDRGRTVALAWLLLRRDQDQR